jgi:hypothetical protein
MKKLEPSNKHGVMQHPLTDGIYANGIYAGFYIENGNTPELNEYMEKHYTKKVSDSDGEDVARERLEPIRTDLQAQGYVVGEIEIKSHRDWCLEVFGICSDDEESEFNKEVDRQSV